MAKYIYFGWYYYRNGKSRNKLGEGGVYFTLLSLLSPISSLLVSDKQA